MLGLRASFCIALFSGLLFAAGKPTEFLDCRQELTARKGSDASAVISKQIASEVQMDVLREHLDVLTGKTAPFLFHGLNDRYHDGNKELVRLYLATQLEKLGHKLVFEPFEGGLNFYVEIPGTVAPEEVFEISAHYDSYGSDVPGADDNGSGLGVMLEAARLFALHPPERTLRIVFMDLEEMDFQGSRYHAQKVVEEFQSKAAKRKFMGALIVDMIGWNPTGKKVVHALVLELGEQNDFGETKKKKTAAKNAGYELNLQCAREVCFQFMRFADAEGKRPDLKLTVDTERAKPGTGDHGSYWYKGLPALFLAAPYEHGYVNPENHTRWDTISEMNWEYYTKTSAFAIEAISSIIRPNLRIEANAKNRKSLLAFAELENQQVVREPADFTVLINKEKKKSSWFDRDDDDDDEMSMGQSNVSRAKKMIERAERGFVTLVLESDGEGADVVDADAFHYVPSSDDVESVQKLAERKKAIVLRRKKPGPTNGRELERIQNWMLKNGPYDADDEEELRPPGGFFVEKKIDRGFSGGLLGY